MKKIFNKIRISWKGKEIEGIEIPNKDKEILLLKLDNGYNIGLNKNEIEKMEKIDEIEIEAEEKKGKDEESELTIIGCGGTISSRVDYETGAVIPSMNFSAFEGVGENVKLMELFKVFSEEFTPEHWEILSNAVYEELKEGKKVVILHGTDTMHYTSSALSFSIQNLNNPVVLTGSQRSVDRPSSDAKKNVLDSIYTAKQDFGEVVVVMHSSINDDYSYVHRGTKVRKMHSSRRDAFKSINLNPLARVSYEKGLFEKIEKVYPLKKSGKLGSIENKFNDNVGILYYYPGMREDFVSKFNDFEGIVIAGSGLGHISAGVNKEEHIKPIIKSIRELIESDVKVVMATQTIYGRVDMSVYSTGRKLLEAGVIGNYCDFTIETAFVKLSWVLGKEKRYKKVKELMEKNIVGELSDRSELV